MTANEILGKLKTLGSESTKKVLLKHGAREPFYGVKIDELKKIQKIVKKDHQLAIELYDSGVSDAMYLAGLIADETKMTKSDLQRWADNAYWSMLSEYTVAWVSAESKYGKELALEWIDNPDERLATVGWSTLSGIVSLQPDEAIDKELIRSLLDRVEREIHSVPDRVRYVMNGFVIAVGAYIPSLTDYAIDLGNRIGTVKVNMGDTACKVPSIPVYIEKVRQKGNLGRKKKTVRC